MYQPALWSWVCYPRCVYMPFDVVRGTQFVFVAQWQFCAAQGLLLQWHSPCAAVHSPLVGLSLFDLFWTPLGRMPGFSVSLRLESVHVHTTLCVLLPARTAFAS
jgi:hypothetical protein